MFDSASWVSSMGQIARHYGISFSAQSALNSSAWAKEESQDKKLAVLGRHLGLSIRVYMPNDFRLTAWRLPVICELTDSSIAIITTLSESGEAGVLLSEDQDITPIAMVDLLPKIHRFVVARPLRTLVDERVDSYISPYHEGWLRRVALPDLRPYKYVLLATFVANILGLTGIIFTRQVYDRVIPAQSFNTLYVLFIGVILAAIFDFTMRQARTKITDTLGKNADNRLSDHVFGHALRVKNSARPKSSGSFIAQLRELEALRETLTSTTISIVSDIPFFFLFLFFFWYIAGTLAFVPLGAVVVLILPGIIMQKQLTKHVRDEMRESSMRNAMLVEAVQGIEDIKSLQAEDRFQLRWNHFNAVAAEAQLKKRSITSFLQAWGYIVQTSVFTTIVFVGAPKVMDGDLTTGTLIACSILGSRMMGPMAQFSQIFSRLQQAKLGYESIDGILQMPVDHPDRESRIGVPMLSGEYHLSNANFYHDSEKSRVVLKISDLKIAPGEKIAVLGRVGAGKSTFLHALGGLLEPGEGEVLLDNFSLGHVDPADLRRDVGLLTQDSRLFHGTLRDNLIMGAPQASDSEIAEALKISGADKFISRMTQGLNYPLSENGQGLSGGQRQAIMLARLILRNPRIVLLDEPTASMDEKTERNLISALNVWGKDRTLILATHRMSVLDLVDRVVVIEKGEVSLDCSKAEFMLKARSVRQSSSEKRSKSVKNSDRRSSSPNTSIPYDTADRVK